LKHLQDQQKPKELNFKLKNKFDIKNKRTIYLAQQEIERVRYIEIVNSDALIRENNKNFLVRKQMKKQEMLLQPLEFSGNSNSNDPRNPL